MILLSERSNTKDKYQLIGSKCLRLVHLKYRILALFFGGRVVAMEKKVFGKRLIPNGGRCRIIGV